MSGYFCVKVAQVPARTEEKKSDESKKVLMKQLEEEVGKKNMANTGEAK